MSFADEQAGADEDDDEVRKLKVCIELKGLRLSKAAAAAGALSPDGTQIKQERAWPHPRSVASAQSLRERKIRAGEPEDRATAQRAEINRKWGCEKLLNGKSEQPAVQTAALDLISSSARVTEIYLWLTFHFLVERSVFWGISREPSGRLQRK